jgi:hypothetical protein
LARLLGASYSDLHVSEKVTISCALGLGALQFMGFGLAALHVLRPTAVWIGLGVAALLLLPDIFTISRTFLREARIWVHTPYPKVHVFLIIAVGLLLAFALPIAVLPPIENDGLSYHLNAPKRWLQAGGMTYLPTYVTMQPPIGVQMLLMLPLAVWSDTAAKLVIFGIGIITLGGIFSLGRRAFSVHVAIAASALYLVGLPPSNFLGAITVMTQLFTEIGVAMFAVSAALATLIWRDKRTTGWLIVAGLCAGFTATTKISALSVALVLAAFIALECLRDGESRNVAVRKGAVLLGIATVPLIPWFVRSLIETGNPLYPMAAGIFPSKDLDKATGASLASWYKYYNWGWGHPEWSYGMRASMRLGAILLALAGGALVAWRAKRAETRLLAMLVGFWAASTMWGFGLYGRYLLPTIPLAYLLALGFLSNLVRHKPWAFATAALIICISAGAYVKKRIGSFEQTVEYALGGKDRGEYLQENLNLMSHWNFINQEPPGDGRVLVAGLYPAFQTTGGASYYCNRYCLITDAFLQGAIRLDTFEHFIEDAKRFKVEYVVVPNIGPFKNTLAPPAAPIAHELEYARRLGDEAGKVVLTADKTSLYRLDADALAKIDVAERESEPIKSRGRR